MARTVSGYSRTQIALHWAIALLILLQFLGGDFVSEYYEKVVDSGAQQNAAPILAKAHVILGIATVALMVLRLVVRLWQGVPDAPADEDPRLKLVAKLTHGLLYLALFLVPVSGLVGWFGANTLAAFVHTTLTSVLLAFVGLHVAAALYHHFILKNNLLARIVPEPVLRRIIPAKLQDTLR